MNQSEMYKGFSFEPASQKLSNGKYFPRGEIVKALSHGVTRIMKTFDGEYSTKIDADKAFIENAKKFIDVTYSEQT